MADPWANDPVVGNVNVTSSGAGTGAYGLPVAKLTITPPGASGGGAGGILAPSASDTPWANDPIVQPAQIAAPSNVPVAGIGQALTALSGAADQQQAPAPPVPMQQGQPIQPQQQPSPIPLGQLAPPPTQPSILPRVAGAPPAAFNAPSITPAPPAASPMWQAIQAKILSDIRAQHPAPPSNADVASNPMASALPGPLGQFANTMMANSVGMGQGMTSGLGDEAFSAAAAVPAAIASLMRGDGLNYGQQFQSEEARQQQQLQQAQALNPGAYRSGDNTGSVAQGLMSGGIFSGRAKQTLASMVGRAAADGAIYGAMNGFGRSNGDIGQRAQAAAEGAVPNALTGGMMGLAGGSMVNGYKGGNPAAPSLDDLRVAKNKAYGDVETAGVRYSPNAYSDLVDSIIKDAAAKGVNIDRHPRVVSVIKEMAARANTGVTQVGPNNSVFHGTYAPTLKELDQWRQVVTRDLINPAVGNPTGAAEAEFGHDIVDAIDHFIDTASPSQIIAGSNPATAAAAIRKARLMNSIYRKAETLDRASYEAGLASDSSGTGANYINTLKQKIKGILTNPKRARGFNPLERQMMESIIHGSPAENAARSIGKKFSLNSVNAAPYAIVGTMFHPAAGLPVVGVAAKAAAEQMALAKIARLREMIVSSGKTLPAAAPAPLPVRQGLGAVTSYTGATVPRKPGVKTATDLAGWLALAALPMPREEGGH